MNILEVRNLSVKYFPASKVVTALDGVSLDVKRNGSLAVIGESGSGKSTLASAVMGLIMPWEGRITSGEILFLGSDGKTVTIASGGHDYSPAAKSLRGTKIALIPQDAAAALNPVMRIYPQIAEAVKPQMSKEAVRKKVSEAVAKARFPEDALDAFAHQISGGQKQRAVIAAALVNSPDLLIADEPTSGLDAAVAQEIIDTLAALNAETGMSLIAITHDIRVATRLCDDAIIMRDGRVCEAGSLKSITRKPDHPYTKSLMGAVITAEKLFPTETPKLENA